MSNAFHWYRCLKSKIYDNKVPTEIVSVFRVKHCKIDNNALEKTETSEVPHTKLLTEGFRQKQKVWASHLESCNYRPWLQPRFILCQSLWYGAFLNFIFILNKMWGPTTNKPSQKSQSPWMKIFALLKRHNQALRKNHGHANPNLPECKIATNHIYSMNCGVFLLYIKSHFKKKKKHFQKTMKVLPKPSSLCSPHDRPVSWEKRCWSKEYECIWKANRSKRWQISVSK